MQRIVVTLLIIATLAFAASRKSVTPISDGITLGSITNLGTQDATAPYLYSYYVPENVSSVRFAINNNNYDDCTYIDVYFMEDIPPCDLDTFGIVDDNTFCNLGYNSLYSSYYSQQLIFKPDYDYYYFDWEVGSNVYIGVGTDSTYLGSVCAYTLVAEVNTTCNTGSIAVYNSSTDSDFSCVEYIAVSSAVNFTTTIINATDSTYLGMYRFPVPANTGYIHIHIDTDADLDVYGKVNAGPSSSDYDCYMSGSDMTCYVPESGYFYVVIQNDDSNGDLFNFTMTSDIGVCTGGLVGYNCTFPSVQITDFNATYTVSFNETSGFESLNFRYFYFDAPAILNSTNLQLNVAIKNTTGYDSAYVIVSKNNFPERSSARVSTQTQDLEIDDPVTWVYTFYDAIGEEQRNWIGVGCYYYVCNITLWFTIPAVTTTTTTTAAAATTTSTSSTAAAATTTTSTSSAAATTTTSTASATSTGNATSTTASATSTGNATSTTASATSTGNSTSTTGNTTTTTGNTTTAAAATSTSTAAATATTSTTGSGSVVVASLLIVIVAAFL